MSDLIRLAKELGMTTMIVTNGTRLTNKFLSENADFLDWIALSVDSLNVNNNLKAGRAINSKKAVTAEKYLQIIERIKQYGYRFKVNTVVSSANFEEDMSEFILKTKPEL